MNSEPPPRAPLSLHDDRCCGAGREEERHIAQPETRNRGRFTKYNPQHSWTYYSKQTRDEVLCYLVRVDPTHGAAPPEL